MKQRRGRCPLSDAVSASTAFAGVSLMAACFAGSASSSVKKTLLCSVPPNHRRRVNLPSMMRPTQSLPRNTELTGNLFYREGRTSCNANSADVTSVMSKKGDGASEPLESRNATRLPLLPMAQRGSFFRSCPYRIEPAKFHACRAIARSTISPTIWL